MNTINQFVKYVKLDEEKRILLAVQNSYQTFLHEEESKKMILEGLKSILNDDFKKLEIGKNVCRITVQEGKEEECKEKIYEELVKGLEMAMAFMSQMQNKDNQ